MSEAPREARAWLPGAALTDGALDRLVCGAVEGWSAKWLARGALRPLHALAATATGAAAGSDGEWLVLDDGAAVSAGAAAALGLALAMIDARGAKPQTDADRALLERVAAAAMEDLCTRLTGAFKLPPGSQWQRAARLPPAFAEDGVGCEIGAEPEESLLRMRFTAEFAIALRKSCAGSVPRKTALGSVDLALGRQPVSASALLGRCSVTLSELSGLAVGDVLILDGNPTGPLDLAIAGGARAAGCTLDDDGGGYRLKIL
jgi:flagellar motor switch/type III secretory pathway protein FliN